MKTEFTQEEKRLLIIHYAVDEEFQRRVKNVPPGTTEGWHPIHEMPYRVLRRAIDDVLTQSGSFGPISSEALEATVSSAPDAVSMLNSSNMIARNELTELLQVIKDHDIGICQQGSSRRQFFGGHRSEAGLLPPSPTGACTQAAPGRGPQCDRRRGPPAGRYRHHSLRPDTDPIEPGYAIVPGERNLTKRGETVPLSGHCAAEDISCRDGEA